MKSVVYESLRIEPPVPLQFGRAKRDMVIESHDAAFEVREGEMLFGFQPFATKDPKIFERSEEFVPGRFVGEEGEGLLRHVLWSNGPETESPTAGNKQCAGKDFVVLVSRLLVVEFFLRYDSFEIEVGKSPLGANLLVVEDEEWCLMEAFPSNGYRVRGGRGMGKFAPGGGSRDGHMVLFRPNYRREPTEGSH
ncbi:hypothetical protein RHGRI_016945 [Rhododendron griersonianum]|nr:hypothetical protein RHGRI_016945 [Rhododendron griersonianum]